MQAEIPIHFLPGQMMQECSQADAGTGHRVGVVDVEGSHNSEGRFKREYSICFSQRDGA